MSKRYAKKAMAFVGCMILAAAVSVGALGVSPASFTAARAETVAVTPASLITAENADVKAGKLNTGAAADTGEEKWDKTGLTVSSDGAYSAALNGVFTDETVRFEFAFTEPAQDGVGNFNKANGKFTFRITSVARPTDYFDIVYENKAGYGDSYVYSGVVYQGETRSATKDAEQTIYEYLGAEWTYIYAPFSGADAGTGNRNQAADTAVLTLSWEDTDVLDVCWKYWDQIFASVEFDGTQSIANGTSPQYGLPKLSDFKEGYTVTLLSETGTDICLTKLTVDGVDYDLTGSAAFASEPQWYSDYVNKVSIGLSEAPMRYWKPVLGAYAVPSATYTVGSDAQKLPVEKAEFVPAGGGEPIAAEVGGKVFLSKGEYTLRYTALVGGTATGNTADYPVTVGDYILTENLLTSENGAAAESGKTTDGANPVTGLTVSGGTGYRAAFAGTFEGDTKLNFALLSHSIEKGSFTFKVASATDSTDSFEICIVPSTWERTTVYVKYKNEFRMATDGSLFYHATSINDLPDLAGNNGYTWVSIPLAGTQKDTANSYISLEWEGGVLCVKAVSSHTNSGYTIAKFDGLTEKGESSHVDEVNKDVYANCCLPKLDWTAYTISFGSDYADEVEPANNGTDVCFTAINGTSLRSKFIADASGVPVTPQNAVISGVEESVTENATVDSVSGDYGVSVTYDGVTIGSFTSDPMTERLLAEEINSNSIDFSKYSDYTLHYSFAGAAEKQQALSVVDAPAVLKWKNGVAAAQTILGGNDLVFSAADIEATDRVDGVLTLTESNLSVAVLAPGAQTAQSVQLGAAYSPESLGEYEVVYTVKDNTGKTSSLTRTIKVIDGNVPVIVLDGEVPQSAVPGSTIALPSASAKDGDKSISVTCSALFTDAEGNKTVLDVSGGTLSLEKAGIYTVSWYAVDDDGNEALESFTITVGEDKEPPVISVGELPAEAKVGDVITLPTYSAQDAVSGACEVNVTVTLGSEQIALDGNSFKAEKEGIYAVRFTAVDEAGNYVALDPVYIRVTGDGADNGGMTGLIIGLSVGAVVVAAAVVLTIVLAKKNKGQKAGETVSEDGSEADGTESKPEADGTETEPETDGTEAESEEDDPASKQ